MEQFMKIFIRKAGKEMLGLFGKIGAKHSKETLHDVVTEADLLSQRILEKAIKAHHPTHGIIGEEEDLAHQSDADYVWYLDPLDGTRNFASHVPLFGINMALAHKNKVIYAAIYLPVTDDLCIAETGKGTRLNGKQVKNSGKREWDYSNGIGPISTTKKSLELREKVGKISNYTAWMTCIASPAVSAVYVASGRRDWYLSRGSKVWDYAAPSLILKEAGCVVTNAKGEDWSIGDKELLATNKYLHPKLLETIKA